MKRCSLLLIPALLSVVFIHPLAAAATDQDPLLEAASDTLLAKALSSLYSLDYEETTTYSLRFIRKHPDNPFGHLFAAGALWWQATTEHGTLEQTPALAERFEHHVNMTLKKAKKLRKSPDKSQRPDGLFAAGLVLGLRGQWKLAEGHWYRAYRDGKKAIKYLKKCVKLDPEYYDAYVGLGLFDYQTARLPIILRLGAKLFLRGVGNAERGLERMRLAVDKGHFTSQQAEALLLTIYMVSEKDYARAMEITQRILSDYPESPYYGFIEVVVLNLMGDFNSSYLRAQDLYQHLRQKQECFGVKQRGTLCGLYGLRCLEEQNLRGAVDWLSKAIDLEAQGRSPAAAEGERRNQPPPVPGFKALLHLYRALAYDLLRVRTKATRDYKMLLDLPGVCTQWRLWAAHCLHTPCDRDSAARFLAGLAPSAPLRAQPTKP